MERPREVSREEFVRRMPEQEEWGAGPGAPETEEPVQGRPGGGSATTADGSSLDPAEADRLSARRPPRGD